MLRRISAPFRTIAVFNFFINIFLNNIIKNAAALIKVNFCRKLFTSEYRLALRKFTHV